MTENQLKMLLDNPFKYNSSSYLDTLDTTEYSYETDRDFISFSEDVGLGVENADIIYYLNKNGKIKSNSFLSLDENQLAEFEKLLSQDERDSDK